MLWRSQLSHVALGVADVPASVAYYRDIFGLQVGEQLDGGGCLLGHGAGHHVLELAPGSGVLHFGLEIRGVDLGAVQRHLSDAGQSPVPEHSTTGELEALWLTDPDKNMIQIHGGIDRSGERGTDGGLRPQRADHITFGTRDVEEMVTFYTGVLGLRISDRMEDDFVWMRGDRHHHDVAVVRAAEPTLDHYSFEVGSWTNIGQWCDRFARLGVPVTWGPGRHGPGNNLFVFVADPDGRQVELSCEMEIFWDDHAAYARDARVWPRSAAIGNLWGPLPAWRDAVMHSA